MSRPLETIKRDVRKANRHRPPQIPDQIDSLDSTATPYHHGGPYDATLASHNLHPSSSPVAAVHDSNMEAIRATPPAYIRDSLRMHVPLQGTSTVPVGETDMSGHVMEYVEGADLMREGDAAGGAYKRWEGMVSPTL